MDVEESVQHIQPTAGERIQQLTQGRKQIRGGNREARQGMETMCSNYYSLCVIGNISPCLLKLHNN